VQRRNTFALAFRHIQYNLAALAAHGHVGERFGATLEREDRVDCGL
jgi:hypothetical protein